MIVAARPDLLGSVVTQIITSTGPAALHPGWANGSSDRLAAPLTGALIGSTVLVAGARMRRRPSSRITSPRSSPAGGERPAHASPGWPHRLGRLLLVVVVALLAGPLVAASSIVIAVVLPRWQRARTAARQQRAVTSAYPDAIDLVVLGVRAGMLPSAALAAATDFVSAPVRPAFLAVTTRLERGDRFADALSDLEWHVGASARPLIDSFAAADRYGLPLAPVLERLAAEARHQRRRAADTAARQLPVRLSLPLVLCTLPSFVLLAIVPLLLGAFSSLHAQ